jgi:hypothetical protein
MAARTPGSASTDGTMASSPSSPPSASVAELQHTLGRAPCSSLYHDLRFADSYSAEWGPLLPSLSNPLFRTFDVTGLRCPTRSKNKQEMLQMPEHSLDRGTRRCVSSAAITRGGAAARWWSRIASTQTPVVSSFPVSVWITPCSASPRGTRCGSSSHRPPHRHECRCGNWTGTSRYLSMSGTRSITFCFWIAPSRSTACITRTSTT